jgi:hypothetical protein
LALCWASNCRAIQKQIPWIRVHLEIEGGVYLGDFGSIFKSGPSSLRWRVTHWRYHSNEHRWKGDKLRVQGPLDFYWNF